MLDDNCIVWAITSFLTAIGGCGKDRNGDIVPKWSKMRENGENCLK